MDYGFFDDILKDDFPDIYQDLHSEQSDLAVDLIQYRLALKVSPEALANLLGMTEDNYLNYEFGSRSLSIDNYNELLRKVDKLHRLSRGFSFPKQLLSNISDYYINNSLNLLKMVFTKLDGKTLGRVNNNQTRIVKLNESKLSFEIDDRTILYDTYKNKKKVEEEETWKRVQCRA